MKGEFDMKRSFPPHAQIFKLTFTFFGTGMVMFVVAMIAGIWIFPQLLEDQSVRNVNGWALAHLFLLGWATMIAMGASYQLTQVLLRTNIYSRLLGVIHYIFYVIGFLLLIVSFIISFPEGLFIGGLFVLIGVIAYIGNIVKTFMKKRAWSLFHLGVTLSLGALLLTVMTGLFMGLSFNRIRLPFSYEALLATHLWLGIGGWLSGLIIVYSFKLIPMFYSSPRRAHVEAYMILLLFHGGIWCRMVAIWWGRGSFEIVAHLCIVDRK